MGLGPGGAVVFSSWEQEETNATKVKSRESNQGGLFSRNLLQPNRKAGGGTPESTIQYQTKYIHII